MTGALAFHFVLLCLFAYRVQRIITTDDWPVSEWFRNGVDERYGPQSAIAKFVQCPWCLGFWISVAIVMIDWYSPIPTVILFLGAVSTIVGLIGNSD